MAAAIKWFMILAIVAMLGGAAFLVVRQQQAAREIVGDVQEEPAAETRKASAPQSERQKAFSDADQMRRQAEEAQFQAERKQRKVEEEVRRMEEGDMGESDSGPARAEHLLGD